MAATLDALINNNVARSDNPIILACNRHQAWIAPVRLVYAAGGYAAGTVIARITSSGLYAKYDDANSPAGVGVAVGVLFADANPASGDTEASRAIMGGKVYQAKLTGLDANGITDLKGRSVYDAAGNQILTF